MPFVLFISDTFLIAVSSVCFTVKGFLRYARSSENCELFDFLAAIVSMCKSVSYRDSKRCLEEEVILFRPEMYSCTLVPRFVDIFS
jgi:hypothetical protein